MIYNIKEYSYKFDTPAKKAQERVIVEKIMSLLNHNKYDNIDKFMEENPTYQDFLKKQNFDNVVKHFGNTINEEDFKIILNNFKTLNNNKQSFAIGGIKTVNIENNEYNSYKSDDKTVFLDNTNSNKKIEEQMKDLQPTQEKFQTNDKEENTKQMMNELQKEKKENLNINDLDTINTSSLSKKEMELYNVARTYEEKNNDNIKIDFERNLIVDNDNDVSKIEKDDEDNFKIIGNENKEENVEINNEEKEVEKSFQKSLKKMPSTLYTNNN